MAINKMKEAKRLIKVEQYNEAYSLLKNNILNAAYSAKDCKGLSDMYRRMAKSVEEAISAYINQTEYKGFYDCRLEGVGGVEAETLKKSLVHLQKQADLYENLYYMYNDLIGIYNEAIGE